MELHFLDPWTNKLVYYESRKRELKIRPTWTELRECFGLRQSEPLDQKVFSTGESIKTGPVTFAGPGPVVPPPQNPEVSFGP
jgi:hypothetical protein